MSKRRDIHDYLDGSLDGGREEELFKNIGSSDEVRREFNEQYEFHRSAKKLAATVSVPAFAREELFKKLEITETPKIPLPLPAAHNNFLKTALFASCFVGAILVGLWQFSLQKHIFNAENKAENSFKNALVNNGGIEKKDIGISSEKFLKEEVLPAKNVVLKTGKTTKFAGENDVKNLNLVNNSNQNFATIHSVEFTENPVVKPGNSFKNTFAAISFSAPGDFFEQPLQVQFRSDAAFKNVTASALYHVSPVDKFGVEIGYEEFQQKYNLLIEDEITPVPRIQPMPVFSIAYRRDFDEISFKNITPFAQLNAGGTSEGGLLKGMIGAQISAFGGMNFIVGAETAAMPFKKQNSWFISRKTGMGFGASFEF